MDAINSTCIRLSVLALAVGIYARLGLIAGIATFLIGWIFMLAMEEGD